MLVRVLLLAVASLLLASSVSAGCSTTAVCTTVTTSHTGTTSEEVSVSLSFSYESNGDICGIFATAFPPSAAFQGSGVTQKVNLIQSITGTVTVSGGQNNEAVTFIDAHFTDYNNVVGVLDGTISPLASLSATLQYSPFGLSAAAAVTSVGTDTCGGSGTADPIFMGFHGQRFLVKGEVGNTYNILSTPVMQMNSRLVQLNKGESMGRKEQKWARLKSLFSLPETHWFDHAGPYMGELGLITLEGHQLYAQVGSYLTGWDIVTADNVNLTVTSTVVFGTGENAVTIFRPNTHQLVIETSLVSLTVSNSDWFLNVDRAQLKHSTTDSLGGALGVTADSAWKAHDGDKKWEKKLEHEVLVESNDLFEMSPLPASAS